MNPEEERFNQALFELLEKGMIEITGIDENGDEFYQLTDKGKKHYEEMQRKFGL